jgi:formylglycine-generating enzyme required for sulfatase activity
MKKTATLLHFLIPLLAGFLVVSGVAVLTGGCDMPTLTEYLNEDADPLAPSEVTVSNYSVSGETATVDFTSAQDGTYYVAAYPSGSKPADAAAIAANPDSVSGEAVIGTNTVTLTGLTENATYKAYVAVKDAAGKYHYHSKTSSSSAFTTVYNSSVRASVSWGQVRDYDGTNMAGVATVDFISNKSGDWYLAVYPSSGGLGPTSQQVIDEPLCTGTAVAGVCVTVPLTGLTDEQGCRVYIVVKDERSIDSDHALWSSGVFTPSRFTLDTPDSYKVMVSVNSVPIVITGSGTAGAFPGGRTVTLSPYEISKYEITYELWREVRIWGVNNGYTFVNQGREGNDGVIGAKSTDSRTEPVTTVIWQDAIVWCNAYSEKEGREPVYYTDVGYTDVLKSLTNGVVYMKRTAAAQASKTGYRLPTEAEWEAAARGGDPSSSNWDYTYAGADDPPGAVAWYQGNASKTFDVGMRVGNALSLMDMCGNVQEWCWDRYGVINKESVTNPYGPLSGDAHVLRGGAYSTDSAYLECTSRSQGRSDYRIAAQNYTGFRVARTSGTTQGDGPELSGQMLDNYLMTATGTTADLYFTSDKAGTYYVIVYPAAEAAPDSSGFATAYANASIKKTGTAQAGISTRVQIANLTRGTAYRVHLAVRADSFWSAVWSSGSFTPTWYNYTITYNGNGNTGGAAPAIQYVKMGESVSLSSLGNLTKTNYAFRGWNIYSNGSGTTYQAGAVYTPTANITLYARWLPEYQLVYDKNDADRGTAPASVKVVQGESFTIPGGSAMTKYNYIYGGWCARTDGTGTVYQAGQVVAVDTIFTSGAAGQSVFLYVKWADLTESSAYRSMKDVPAVPAGKSYPDPDGTNVNGGAALPAYKIASYETTYELWYTVKGWAGINGYTFTNTGREGADGRSGTYSSTFSDGTAPSGDKLEPVTNINWLDALAWCNAYSELTGKTPVYKYNGAVLKNAGTATASSVTADADADGYRLPTVDEWMVAARGGDPANTTHWPYKYAGSNNANDVGWHSGNKPGTSTSQVGMKAQNLLGLFDMTGNVREWCWDNLGTNLRQYKGGSWQDEASYCDTSYTVSSSATAVNNYTGFRVVCKP